VCGRANVKQFYERLLLIKGGASLLINLTCIGFFIVWTVDFETPVCKLYLLFISADAAQEKEKKEKKVLLPTGVSKSTVHTVLFNI
jgi:hypothetical protein